MSAALAPVAAGKPSIKILGNPRFLMNLLHPDDILPFIEVGFTVDGMYPTVIIQNVRTNGGQGGWTQTPLDIAARISAATLCAIVAAIGEEETETKVGQVMERAVAAIPMHLLPQLSEAASHIAIAAMKRTENGHL